MTCHNFVAAMDRIADQAYALVFLMLHPWTSTNDMFNYIHRKSLILFTLFLFLFISFLHDTFFLHSQLSPKEIFCCSRHFLFTKLIILQHRFIAKIKNKFWYNILKYVINSTLRIPTYATCSTETQQVNMMLCLTDPESENLYCTN